MRGFIVINIGGFASKVKMFKKGKFFPNEPGQQWGDASRFRKICSE